MFANVLRLYDGWDKVAVIFPKTQIIPTQNRL